MENNEMVLFESRDGAVTLPVSIREATVWLTRMQMADLFGVTPQNITINLKKVYSAGELDKASTSKDFLLVQTEGGRQITRSVNGYNLDAIISVGYRVNSVRETQFRIWATKVLKEYIVRGYVVNRERMRQLGQTVEVMKRVAKAHRRPHARRADGDDRRVQAAGERADGQSRDDVSEMSGTENEYGDKSFDGDISGKCKCRGP